MKEPLIIQRRLGANGVRDTFGNALLPLLIAVVIICSICSLFTYGIVGADSEDDSSRTMVPQSHTGVLKKSFAFDLKCYQCCFDVALILSAFLVSLWGWHLSRPPAAHEDGPTHARKALV
jgi:hypothetical protein